MHQIPQISISLNAVPWIEELRVSGPLIKKCSDVFGRKSQWITANLKTTGCATNVYMPSSILFHLIWYRAGVETSKEDYCIAHSLLCTFSSLPYAKWGGKNWGKILDGMQILILPSVHYWKFWNTTHLLHQRLKQILNFQLGQHGSHTGMSE